ncbi:MAG: TolC family protein [Syntrophobacteraceae bacterium]
MARRMPVLVSIVVVSALLFCLPVFAQRDVQGATRTDLDAEIGLEELLKAAAENNPSIKSAEYGAAASKSSARAASALPDPTVTFEHMGKLVPFKLMPGDPSSARTYGVEQDIPFPGKLGLKGSMATSEAKAQGWNHVLVQRQVVSELKQAYYDLYFLRKSIDILLKTKDLYQNFEQIAQSRYQVGQAIQQDVLKAQVELSKILDRTLILGQKKRIAEAKINNLLYRPSDAPVGRPAEFKKAVLKHSLEELTEAALSGAPALKVQESEITRRQYGVELARKEFYPDFTLGFTYYDREGEPNPEMFGVMLKAKLPLYFWARQKPELEAARLNLAGARTMRDSTTSTLRFQVKEGYTMAATSERLAKLYSSAIVPQANLTLNSAIANYQVGKIDFLQLTDSSVALLEYELKYYESIIEFHKALAQLEALTGLDLTM